MNLFNYISTLIHERNVYIERNDQKPGGDDIANAKAEQILDNLYYLYREAKLQANIEVVELLQNVFLNTYYKPLFS